MSVSVNNLAKMRSSLSSEDVEKIVRWEKERGEGKAFWIFRRAAAWLFVAILLYGAANFFFSDFIKLDLRQSFIAGFMFLGFVFGLHLEWSKMEDFYQKNFSAE